MVAFEGIITVEHILERIVGDIRDEWEPELEPGVRELDEGSCDVRGSVVVREVNEARGTDFEDRRFGTIGGVVLEPLDRAPEVGDEAHLDGGTRCACGGNRRRPCRPDKRAE